MIDFVKLNISYLKEKDLLDNPLLDFKMVTSHSTGEVFYPFKASYLNLNFIIQRTFKLVAGSLHTYWNTLNGKEENNANDFSYTDLQNTIADIESKFGIISEQTIIQNLEFGVNASIPISPDDLIQNHIIVYDGQSPNKNYNFNSKGRYIQFRRNEKSKIIHKLYDKGKQFNMKEHLLRWETKILQNKLLHKHGIKTIGDFNDVTIESLGNELLMSFNKLLIVDSVEPNIKFHSNIQEKVFINSINPKWWEAQQSKDRSTKKRQRQKVDNLYSMYELDLLKKDIEKQINTKWSQLKKRNVIHDFTKSKNATLSTLHICGNRCKNKRTCQVTGINITHQQNSSKFLSEKSVRELADSDLEIYEKLEKEYGCKDCGDLIERSYYIAHNIRNRFWNKKYEITKKKEKYSQSLFPINDNSVRSELN